MTKINKYETVIFNSKLCLKICEFLVKSKKYYEIKKKVGTLLHYFGACFSASLKRVFFISLCPIITLKDEYSYWFYRICKH